MWEKDLEVSLTHVSENEADCLDLFSFIVELGEGATVTVCEVDT